MIFLFFLSLIGAKIVFKPLNNIISTAQRINQNNLSERIIIDASPDDEIGKLRDTINELFDKIENYINELKHFTDLVSHQLMNPITAIITEIEYVLKRDRSIEEYKASLQRLEEKVDSMANIIKTLLLIARSEKSKTKSEFVFNFSKLLRKEIENYFSKNYLNNNFNLKTYIEAELYLRGEAEKFSMVLQNLFSNAKKFSIDSLDVTIKAFKNNNKIILEVADKGIGIDDDDKIKVFNKFYRTEKAEKLGILGFGLGLNLVKTIVEEASGKIEILDNHPNGTIIKITLPSIELED
jgi:signal transduction histidine kinase